MNTSFFLFSFVLELVRVWAKPAAVEQGAYALSIATQLLGHFEQFYGIKYPLPKLDLIAIPEYTYLRS